MSLQYLDPRNPSHLLLPQSPSVINRLSHAKPVSCKVKNMQSLPLSQHKKNHYFGTVSKNKEPLPHLQSFKKSHQTTFARKLRQFYLHILQNPSGDSHAKPVRSTCPHQPTFAHKTSQFTILKYIILFCKCCYSIMAKMK